MTSEHAIIGALRRLVLSTDLPAAIKEHPEDVKQVVSSLYPLQRLVRDQIKGYAALLTASMEVIVEANRLDPANATDNLDIFCEIAKAAVTDRPIQKKAVVLLARHIDSASPKDNLYTESLYSAVRLSSYLEEGSDAEKILVGALASGIRKYSLVDAEGAFILVDNLLGIKEGDLTLREFPAPSQAVVACVREIAAEIFCTYRPARHPKPSQLSAFRGDYLKV